MQVSHIIRALPVLLWCARAAAAQTPGAQTPASASSTRFRVATDNAAFLQEPGGRRLARLSRGAVVAGGETRGQWVSVTLDGWIFSASVARPAAGSPAADFDLVVTRGPEENLRAAPGVSGAVIGRLAQGFGLERAAGDTARGRWVPVTRAGWVDRAALTAVAADSGTDSVTAAAPPPARPVTVYRAPDGPEAGTLAPETPIRVLSRSGEWARVQLEGWVKADELPVAPPAGVLVGVSAAEVRTEPQRYAGQVLRWRVEYIALQRADELRPDIPAGATYMLARGPLPERGFVYIIVPELKVPAIRALSPLATLSVTARVRAGRSRYLGNPVVELISHEALP